MPEDSINSRPEVVPPDWRELVLDVIGGCDQPGEPVPGRRPPARARVERGKLILLRLSHALLWPKERGGDAP